MNEEYKLIIRFIQEFYDGCSEMYGKGKIDLTKEPESTFSEIGLDSMGVIELLVLAEEKFGISIDGPDLPKEHTIGNYARMIYDKTRGNSND